MVVRKTHISATTGKAFQVDSLSDTQLQEMRRLIGRIKIAAGEYDGSSDKRTRFLSLASQIAHIGGGSPDAIQAYASQAYPSDSGTFSLDKLYLQSRARLRGSKDSESPYGRLLKTFRDYDSAPITNTAAFSMEYKPLGNSAYQPRLATLIDMMCDQGLGIEKIMITTPPYKLPRELRDSYIILSDKSGPLQIAVSDDVTMPTYVSKSLSGKDFWKAPGVKVIQAHDFDYFVEKARLALGFKPEAAPDLHLRSGTQFYDATDIPSGVPDMRVVHFHVPAKEVVFEPVAQDTMSMMFSAWGQMPRVEVPEQTSGWEEDPVVDAALTHLQETRRFIKSAGEGPQGSEILKPWILKRIAEYKATHNGQVPNAESGPIDDYPGLHWAMVDTAIYAHGRHHKMHIDRYAERYLPTPVVRAKAPSEGAVDSVKTPFTQATTRDKTERQKTIIADILSYAAGHQCFPSTGRLNDTPDDKRLWSRHEQWLYNNLDIGLGDFIRQWTREQNSHYQESHGGANAHALAGDIDGYPGYEWSLLDTCFRNYKRGFTTSLSHVLQGTKPERSEAPKAARAGVTRRDAFTSQNFHSLQGLPVEKRMTAAYKFVATDASPQNRNQLMQRILGYARQNDKFPSANDTTESYRIRAYWRTQEEWCLEREKMSLSRLILRWTREKAAEHRKEHDGQQPSSGPIKGFENYDWDMLRRCFAKQQLSPKLEDIVAVDPEGYKLDGSGPAVAVAPEAPRGRRQRGWQRPSV